MLNRNEVLDKYGKTSYEVDEDTFHMGIHHLISDHVAKRFKGSDIVLDACVGGGFMTIALSKYIKKIIAVDIDKKHLTQAQANVQFSTNSSKITFVEGDILEKIKYVGPFDAAFLDPDWARPGEDKTVHVHELRDMEPSGTILFDEVSKITKNICLRLPKEFDILKLKDFPAHEVQSVYLEAKLKFFCVYFGKLMVKAGETELRI